MPIKKDATGKRSVEMETIVPGTPEQVWQALATGNGNAAWFTRATVDERLGGEIRFDFGAAGSSVGEVTTWEPPHRFGYIERNWSEGAPPVATEITITGRAGGQCVMRMVHSLFSSTDDWDDQLESFERGWPAFFNVLRVYLASFAGRPAASLMATANIEGDHLDVWKRLMNDLALAGVDAGERRTTPPLPETLSGVVERVQLSEQERLLVMRLEAPAPGVALISSCLAGPAVTVGVNLYYYGEDAPARAAASAPKWQSWVREGLSLRSQGDRGGQGDHGMAPTR
jgi:uncharacterized protein YndB with AHSA1/START domain